jgi:hypothetical protein
MFCYLLLKVELLCFVLSLVQKSKMIGGTHYSKVSSVDSFLKAAASTPLILSFNKCGVCM